jgi:hypothetical protein
MKTPIAMMLLLCAGAALANPNQRPEQRPDGERRGPPPEALEVCKGKAAGTAVEMKTPHGDKVKGVCRMVMIPEHEGRKPER